MPMSSKNIRETLPDFPLAGTRADPVRATTDAEISTRYLIENGYYVPRYPPEDLTRKQRDEKLLDKRIKRFFYSCEPRLDVSCTKTEIDADIAKFDETFSKLSEKRASEGKGPFSLSIPYRDMTDEERAILSEGAHIVGAAVNRLGRLGQTIIQGNRIGVKIEYDDAYIAEHMDAIENEFKALHDKLTDTSHESLVRCVLTRAGRVDHDGVFHHLIREIGKPVMSHFRKFEERMATLDESVDTPITRIARDNIVVDIGRCLDSIDEVNEAIRPIYSSKKFAQLIDDVRAARKGDNPLINPRTNELNLSNYTASLEEYVELSRARASLKSDDHKNCRPVTNRLRHLRDTLAVQHGTLFKYADSIGDIELRNSIKLVVRGVEMIEEMTELRLPRNHTATVIYDKDLKEFEGRDASSVGRFKEKVAREVSRWQDGPTTSVNSTNSYGDAAACSRMAKLVSHHGGQASKHPRIASTSANGQLGVQTGRF